MDVRAVHEVPILGDAYDRQVHLPWNLEAGLEALCADVRVGGAVVGLWERDASPPSSVGICEGA